MMGVLISYMMCVRNDMSTLDRAINSLLLQDMDNWELVIYNNSDNEHRRESESKLNKWKETDPRIKLIDGSHSQGWAKGASICLDYVSGEYTSFLASDDAIRPYVLKGLSRVMTVDKPDVIFVGYDCVSLNESCEEGLLGVHVPPEMEFGTDNRSEAMYLLLGRTYYNSFFHYMKVNFLRKEGIDFFEPYYCDCAGMTRVIARANSILCFNKDVYSLSINTSQTSGWAIWDFYKIVIINQWRTAKEVFIREGFKNEEIITYIAKRFIRNFVGHYSNLCVGRCHDKYMNLIEVAPIVIIGQLNDALTNEEIQEMLILSDDEIFKLMRQEWRFEELLEANPECRELDYDIIPLLSYIAIKEKNGLNNMRRMQLLTKWLECDGNRYCFGINEFIELCDSVSPDILRVFEHTIRHIVENYSKVSRNIMDRIIRV